VPPPAGRPRAQVKRTCQEDHALVIVRDEFRPGYSLIGLLASIARLRFTGTRRLPMHFSEPQGERKHFYFARKGTFLLCLDKASFAIDYKGQYIGEYYSDILVEGVLVIELEMRGSASPMNTTAQCLNSLRASGPSVCLLVNFQKPKAEWRRIGQRLSARRCR